MSGPFLDKKKVLRALRTPKIKDKINCISFTLEVLFRGINILRTITFNTKKLKPITRTF